MRYITVTNFYRLSTIKAADKIVVLDGGQVIEVRATFSVFKINYVTGIVYLR